MLEQKTISIYVHFPWCMRKCYYCDFNSYKLVADKNTIEELYLKKLLADLDYSFEKLLCDYNKPKLLSIFFGGGTPSLLSSKSIEHILTAINKRLHFENNIEISLEVNPGAVEQDIIYNYKAAGVTRISLGVQSFQNDKLKILGRIHNAKDIINSIENIFKSDFNSFNLDLMYGLPTQSIDDAIYDLNMAMSFKPQHISWYQLTIEPNTLFYVNHPVLPSEETIWKIYQEGNRILTSLKYCNYEISAFARDAYYCKHNLNYWHYGDYLGLGPGSHSKLTRHKKLDKSDHFLEITRLIKVNSPKRYLEYSPSNLVVSNRILSKKEIIFEFMLNNLRLQHGFSKDEFTNKTGCDFEVIAKPLQTAFAKNLLQHKNNLIRPTQLGRRFLNDLQQLFL